MYGLSALNLAGIHTHRAGAAVGPRQNLRPVAHASRFFRRPTLFLLGLLSEVTFVRFSSSISPEGLGASETLIEHEFKPYAPRFSRMATLCLTADAAVLSSDEGVQGVGNPGEA